jgi:hypothetical protein
MDVTEMSSCERNAISLQKRGFKPIPKSGNTGVAVQKEEEES